MNQGAGSAPGLYFSDYFQVERQAVESYGAFDISLVADLPLFVDPFLLFASDKPEYRKLHDKIIDYLRFLRAKAAGQALDPALTRALYSFQEVKQNWLGFTRGGNRGAGLGAKFARSLHSNLHTIFGNFGNESVTKSSHLEKLCLVDSGVGRDRISDFTTRLILEFLCEFTQQFAKEHVNPRLRRTFSVQRVSFSYDVQVWIPRKFELPCYQGDFVLLTPSELLTRDDTWISRQDLFRDFAHVPEAIGNETLRAHVNDYFLRQLPKEPSNKDVAKAIDATIRQYPALIDYYIKYKEEHESDAKRSSRINVRYSERVFLEQAASLAHLLAQDSALNRPGITRGLVM